MQFFPQNWASIFILYYSQLHVYMQFYAKMFQKSYKKGTICLQMALELIFYI